MVGRVLRDISKDNQPQILKLSMNQSLLKTHSKLPNHSKPVHYAAKHSKIGVNAAFIRMALCAAKPCCSRLALIGLV